MAQWQSGYAADCKSVYVGSIPACASKQIKGLHDLCKPFLFSVWGFFDIAPRRGVHRNMLSRHPCLSHRRDDWASHEFQRFKIQDGEFPSEYRAGVDVIDVAQYQRFSERGMPCNDCAYPRDT